MSQLQRKDTKDNIKTTIINKIFFNRAIAKEEVDIIHQNVLEFLFYFPELMPKSMILKQFYVPPHFSLLCLLYCSFVTPFIKLNNIMMKGDAHWEITRL